MAIKIGNIGLKNLRVGDLQVLSAYVGTRLVWTLEEAEIKRYFVDGFSVSEIWFDPEASQNYYRIPETTSIDQKDWPVYLRADQKYKVKLTKDNRQSFSLSHI